MGGRQGTTGNSPLTIPIDMVRYSNDHIRKSDFSTERLRDTIADAGLLQPILAQKKDNDFVIIDGARRVAALRELGVRELIVGRDIVIDAEETEADVRFKQIIANVQREDLSGVELGRAFMTLKEQFGYQYNEIAEIIGKTPHYVAAKVGLIKRLDPEVQRQYTADAEAAREGADDGQKCIQNTFSGQPYVMNVNVLEDVARLPREAQAGAYREIAASRMDKETALSYIRTLKTSAATPAQGGRAAMSEAAWAEKVNSIRKQIDRLSRDLEEIMGCISGSTTTDRDIIAEIESIVGQLGTLRDRLKAMDEADDGEMLTARA